MATLLPTTRLGWTGMHVTRVGFGAWAIGGGDWAFAWGNQDDAASVAAIRHAVESGINWIDTAAIYGLGHSEEVVAAALSGLPEADRPYVFTKGGLVWDPADRSAAPRRVGAPASIRTEVEASLRRLRVERIDLYQMHWPAEDGTPLEEYWQVFTDLKREGKIRAAGLSNHGICQLQAAEEIGTVDVIQPPFNLIHRNAADDILLWAREHEAGVIVYSPMASGLLSASGGSVIGALEGVTLSSWNPVRAPRVRATTRSVRPNVLNHKAARRPVPCVSLRAASGAAIPAAMSPRPAGRANSAGR
jgi:aryl-alcohol dehydrogenase-like predicted oxidoreductase